ncbi:tetratricopeptide repeat protein [Leucobacter allii]|uniref:Tetratricopeptide repeat protein n=1 Tax=Leucobacter allii TaxID=2932247 RepID=A0ABY4FJL1_9MICO|nr:tetratricopeptide repeat protein [Leucobacter allii]UOQ56326.1 tetratricopeptide repeat protein [Leucobacter allii]
MTGSWEARIDAYWATADDARPEEALREMRALVSERPADDPDALYEWASVHDFLGREREAVPLYEAALRAGLAGDRERQAVIQLASSLRNTGRPEEAIRLLRDRPAAASPDATVVGDAPRAFLALALRDAGRTDEALRVALTALARTLPRYRAAVERYAEELIEAPAADPLDPPQPRYISR